MPSFSRNLEETLHHAIVLASERRHEHATLEHLLLALVDDPDAAEVMRACSVDVEELRRVVAAYVDIELQTIVVESLEDAKPTTGFQRVIAGAVISVQSASREEVTGSDVLVALFSERESHAAYFLRAQDFDRYAAVNFISHRITRKPGGSSAPPARPEPFPGETPIQKAARALGISEDEVRRRQSAIEQARAQERARRDAKQPTPTIARHGRTSVVRVEHRSRAAWLDEPAAPSLLPPPAHVIDRIVSEALAEDLGDAGDVTSELALPPGAAIRAQFRARSAGRIAGTAVLAATFSQLDPAVSGRVLTPDGADVEAGGVIAVVEGPARAILAGERVALNLLGRLCGIATATRAYVQAVDGTKARIAHTRKTTPGLRALETWAVRCGGGVAHRQGLYDAVLIKDNHVAAAGGVGAALAAVRSKAGHMLRVSVEVDSLAQLEEALPHRPDVVLLDNFSLDDLREAVRRVDGRCVLEASGGVSLQTVRAISETGVDVISVGALTHSAPALDIGLDAV